MSESDKNPVVQTKTAQPAPPPPAPPVQAAPQQDPPLTGSSKSEKTVDYLNRLRTRGQFDPNLPLSNERAREIAGTVSKLIKEEVSPSTVKDARGRLLKLAPQAVNPPPPKPGEKVESHPNPKLPPVQQQGLGSTAGGSSALPSTEKAPLTPQEKESNRKFIDRFVTWSLDKAESQAPPEDKDFIIGTYADALDDSNSKVPGAIKILLASGMLAYYLMKSIGKMRAKLSKPKPPKTPTPATDVKEAAAK